MRSHLGAMLALYRAANNWTVRDIAPRVGISIATLSRIERGHAMDAATLVKLWGWLLTDAHIAKDSEAKAPGSVSLVNE